MRPLAGAPRAGRRCHAPAPTPCLCARILGTPYVLPMQRARSRFTAARNPCIPVPGPGPARRSGDAPATRSPKHKHARRGAPVRGAPRSSPAARAAAPRVRPQPPLAPVRLRACVRAHLAHKLRTARPEASALPPFCTHVICSPTLAGRPAAALLGCAHPPAQGPTHAGPWHPLFRRRPSPPGSPAPSVPPPPRRRASGG
ncbi:MAG: hypothetical protein J3K34DRAFT_378289, partial [Monoraphidium minutum]